MRYTLVGFFAVLSLCGFSSCKLVRGIYYMNKKHTSTYALETPGKDVVMIPLVHFGKVRFYDELKAKVSDYKRKGYVVYYEQVRGQQQKLDVSNEQYDTLRRKYRKMKGGTGTSRKDYQELNKVFKKKRVQPEYEELGITASDVNADVKLTDLVARYEQLYGKVVLDSCDMATPFGSEYECKGLKNKLQPVIVDYRNENLAQMIKSSPDKKILVLYGMGHKKGLKKLLRK